MKFLCDVCASSRALRTLLIDLGHDVLSALDRDPRALDEALLALALQEERVLVTEDKDFGELVFVRRLPHPCIIRFVDMRVEEKVIAMRELLERHADAIREGSPSHPACCGCARLTFRHAEPTRLAADAQHGPVYPGGSHTHRAPHRDPACLL